jgi:hypothetical protein
MTRQVEAGAPTLAERQAALVAALVGGADVPVGFDPRLVQATRSALLRKRAGEVASAWPRTAAAYGDGWTAAFTAWAAARPPNGSLRDGWDFARSAGESLPPLAREELADREARLTYDGRSNPRPKRLAALRARLARH